MLRIAIQGCAHGELKQIYKKIADLERENNYRIDLLLVCGDFQAVRNAEDLAAMSVPPKFKRMGDFVQYFDGTLKAPVLTIFVGGNHEASNFLGELYNGGWVAPNIFYLGHAGVVRFGGLRIAGISGIYKSADADAGYFERLPLNEAHKRSAYHTRRFEALKLSHLAASPTRIDVFLSHEWPRGVHDFGDVLRLLRAKPFFADDVAAGVLGCPFGESLLKMLRPKRWFAAHLHVAFEATVPHPDASSTFFLALDKCRNRSEHLRVVEVPRPDAASSLKSLEFDDEWLAIVAAYQPLIPRGVRAQDIVPLKQAEIEAALARVQAAFGGASRVIPLTQTEVEATLQNVLGIAPANIFGQVS